MSSTCGFDVEDNRRLFVAGKLVDQNSNPVPDISVALSAEGHIVGTGKSDSNGNFAFTGLEALNRDLHIRVNTTPYDSLYTFINIMNNTPAEERNRQVYDLGELEIRERSDLHVKILKTSTGDNSISWNMEYTYAQCHFMINNEELYEEYLECYPVQFTSGVQNQNYPERELLVNSTLGSNVTITYSINDGPQQTDNIFLNEQNMEYVLEY